MLQSKNEADALLKYVQTKFLRALLAVKKGTQHTPKSVWTMIPIQDFSELSDIDWGKNINEIDEQLFDKYQLEEVEKKFIREKVQLM